MRGAQNPLRMRGARHPWSPQGTGKLECLCRVGARAPCPLEQTHPEGFSILGQKWSLLPSFFLPLEYKDFFLQASFTNFNFFFFFFYNGPAGLWPGRRRGWKAVSSAGVFFPKGDVIASLARRVCFLPQGAWKQQGAWTGESRTWPEVMDFMSISWQEQQPGKGALITSPAATHLWGLGVTEALRETCWANFHQECSHIVHFVSSQTIQSSWSTLILPISVTQWCCSSKPRFFSLLWTRSICIWGKKLLQFP